MAQRPSAETRDAHGRARKAQREFLAEISRNLADAGRPIEAGWVMFQALAIKGDATPQALGEMRVAFFSGAMHLFEGILEILDEGVEATNERYLGRMMVVTKELTEFGDELRAKDSGELN